jgi:hypothetical protein
LGPAAKVVIGAISVDVINSNRTIHIQRGALLFEAHIIRGLAFRPDYRTLLQYAIPE